MSPPPFSSLDFVYMPSGDVAADVANFTDRLGAELVFAIEAFGTRVAMVRLTESPPAVLLAGHLHDDRPVLVFRVDDLDAAVAAVEERGFEAGERFEFPYGPGCLLEAPGGQRLAVYELTRPEVGERLAGRRDF
jgi:hypothetical protein